MIRRALLLFALLLLGGCAQSVNRASRTTLASLQQNAVPADPADFEKGALKVRYRWQIPPGTILKGPLNATLGIPSIPGRINGHPTTLILDTGNAFPVLLDANSASAVQMQTIRGGALKGTGIGGNVDVLLARYDSLGFGSHAVLGQGVGGVFLHSYCNTFAGVTLSEMQLNLLGLPFLEQFSSLTIDAPRNEVIFAYKRPFQPPPNAASFPFTIEEGRIWIQIKVGTQTVRAFFDTGCGSGLRLTASALASVPKSAIASPRLRKRNAMGVGGVEQEHVGVLHEATLGTLRVAPLEFDTSAASKDVLLGWLPFRQSRMTIDFEKRKVWVEATKRE